MPSAIYFVELANGKTVVRGYNFARIAAYGGCKVSEFTNSGKKMGVYFTF